MSSFNDFISAGLDDAFEPLKESCTVDLAGGGAVAGEAIFGEIEQSQELQREGYTHGYSVEMVVRKSDYPTKFSRSTVVVFKGYSWRPLMEIREDDASFTYTLVA